nr:PREDICTED: uncharacterized protein LOC102353067 isoform X1 [Latimeria chalumnae]|eukprot:XP_014352801.1 PREDICTED: uncharacterized protein LOC102353067 isoform X1 [Latimeria chalumnae]
MLRRTGGKPGEQKKTEDKRISESKDGVKSDKTKDAQRKGGLPPKSKHTPFYCSVCNIYTSCEKSLMSHINGNKHKTALGQQERARQESKKDDESRWKDSDRNMKSHDGSKYPADRYYQDEIRQVPNESNPMKERDYPKSQEALPSFCHYGDRRRKALEYMENFQIMTDVEASWVLKVTQGLTEALKKYSQWTNEQTLKISQVKPKTDEEFAGSVGVKGVDNWRRGDESHSRTDSNYGSLQKSFDMNERPSPSFYGDRPSPSDMNRSAGRRLPSPERGDSAGGYDWLCPTAKLPPDHIPFLSYSDEESNSPNVFSSDGLLRQRASPPSRRDIPVRSSADFRQTVSNRSFSPERMHYSRDGSWDQESGLRSMGEPAVKEFLPIYGGGSSLMHTSQRDDSRERQSGYNPAAPYYSDRSSCFGPSVNTRPPSPLRMDLDRNRDLMYHNENESARSDYQLRSNRDSVQDFQKNLSGLTPDILDCLRGKDVHTVTAVLNRIAQNNPAMQNVSIPTLVKVLFETGALD